MGTPQRFATAVHDPLEPKRRLPSGCVTAFVVISSLLVLLGAGCGVALSRLSFDFDVGAPRAHLRPIPVPHRVCPYVRVMHSAANDFQHVNPLANPAVLTAKLSWPRRRAQLEQSLNVLEFSVAASKAQFPAPIRRRFVLVLARIRGGRVDLERSADVSEVLTTAGDDFQAGQIAFGEASDLIGNACGVHLAV